MLNPAARIPPYAPSVLAPMPTQRTAAPIQPARGVEISNQSSTAASPPPLVAQTAPKTTQQVTGIARPTLYLPALVPLTPQRRKTPHLPPSATHLNQPPAHFIRLTQMPWTFSRTEQGSPLPLPPPPPPGLECPLEFTTPRAPLRPALMGPSGSTSRTCRPQPDGEPSPSPAPRDQSASRR